MSVSSWAAWPAGSDIFLSQVARYLHPSIAVQLCGLFWVTTFHSTMGESSQQCLGTCTNSVQW